MKVVVMMMVIFVKYESDNGGGHENDVFDKYGSDDGDFCQIWERWLVH